MRVCKHEIFYESNRGLRGLGEFSKVMQTLYCISGYINTEKGLYCLILCYAYLIQQCIWWNFKALHTADSLSSLDVASFIFTLEAFTGGFSVPVPNPVALDERIYFKASVVTQSGATNLDLFPVRCWSSKSMDPNSPDGDVTVIVNG